ncbi:MAG: sigma-70 family RNA polymerase sigma factor, partial [Chloroflexi bacterium]|nr:sigma-70 family RNA polymerase sigma factor [Chloroflexota bacterium]
EDFAHQAIVRMLKAEYPFDVPFAPWALTILHREIWGKARRNKDLLDHEMESLDEWRAGDSETSGMERQVADPLAEIFLRMLQEREVLWNAIKQLSQPLFDVIRLTFFEGLADEEIARKLNTTIENIQTRRHRALARLHLILTGKPMSGKRRHRH